MAQAQETAAQLAAETQTQIFTPLALDLNVHASVQSTLAELAQRDQPIDFLLLNTGLIPGKELLLTDEGIEAAHATILK